MLNIDVLMFLNVFWKITPKSQLMLSLLLCFTYSKWVLSETLKPENDIKGIFGRSVAISKNNTIVVGASLDPASGEEGKGRLYVYDYNTSTGQHNLTEILEPRDNYKNATIVNISNMGYTVEISDDGNTIFAGAPKTSVSGVAEVGAVIVFQREEGEGFDQKQIITPVDDPGDDDEYQGFGKLLGIYGDGSMCVSSYYTDPTIDEYKKERGKVFVSYKSSSDHWETPISIEAYNLSTNDDSLYKFGASFQVISNDSIAIGVELFDEFWDAGTQIFTKNDSSFSFSSDIKPSFLKNGSYDSTKLEKYGSPISGFFENSELKYLGVIGTFSSSSNQNNGAVFLIHKESKGWDTENVQPVYFPDGATLDKIVFSPSAFAALASNFTNNQNPTNIKQAILVYRKSSQLFKFSPSEVIFPPSGANEYLNLGSDIAFSYDGNILVIGAMSMQHNESDSDSDKAELGSSVFVYTWVDDSSSGTLIGLAIFISSCLIVFLIVGLVFYYAKMYKGIIRYSYEEYLNEHELR